MWAHGSEGEAGDGLAEGAGSGRFDGAMFRARPGDDEIEIADLEMLKIVVMTGDIGLNLVFLEEGQDVLDDLRLIAMGDSR